MTAEKKAENAPKATTQAKAKLSDSAKIDILMKAAKANGWTLPKEVEEED